MKRKPTRSISNNVDHWRGVVISSGFLLPFLVLLLAMPRAPEASSAKCSPAPHSSILIESDADFTPSNGVVSGSGTAADPFVISTLGIDDLSPGYAIKVDNSLGAITKYFNIQCIQSNFSILPPTGEKLIWLVNIHTATTIANVSGNSVDAEGAVGVALDDSSNITLDNLSLNRIGENGVVVHSSDHITIVRSKIKTDGSGLSLIDSHDITVGSPCNLSSQVNCNEFTYADDNGIFILNSYNVLVQYTITTADDSGGILVNGPGSYNISFLNGISSGNGPICRTESGTRSPSGEKVDTIAGLAIVNGAHDITVRGYTLRGNTHYDLMNGGDGQYPNPCTNLIEAVSVTPPGGANLNLNDNCYRSAFNFATTPSKNCPKS